MPSAVPWFLGCKQEERVGVGLRQQDGREGRGQHLDREDQPATILLGQNAEKDPADRTGQHRRGNQQSKLGLGQAELLFDADADNREYRPDREAGGKGDRRHA